MHQIAAQRGFMIERPFGMAYIESLGVYTYAVESSLNLQNRVAASPLMLASIAREFRFSMAEPR